MTAVLLCLQGGALAQLPGENWEWRNPLPQGNSLQEIVQSGEQYVVCGRAGTILTSTDGESWMLRDSQTPHYLRRLAVDGSTVVAVGREGAIVRSTDSGTTWAASNSGTDVDLRFIFRVGMRWVAGGTKDFFQGEVVTSSDGVSWTPATGLIGLNNIHAMAASPTSLVLFGRQGTSGLITANSIDDGMSWTTTAAPDGVNFINAAIWTGSRFVALASGSDETKSIFLTSVDGVTWAQNEIMISFPSHLVWTGSLFVVVTNRSIATSSDGLTWTTRFTPPLTDGFISSITSDDSSLLAVADVGDVYQSSDGGLTWETRSSGITYNLNRSIRTASGSWIVTGADGTILTSPTGEIWTERSSGVRLRMRGVAVSDGKWIAVGRQFDSFGAESGAVLLSEDGIDWAPIASPPETGLYSVTRVGEEWIATGRAQVFHSADGLTWTAGSLAATTLEVRALATNGTRLVVVGGDEGDEEGSESHIQISDDNGATWSFSYNNSFFGFLRDVTWTGTQFVAVGDGGLILTSATGDVDSWLETSLAFVGDFRSVTSADGLIVIVGGSGGLDDNTQIHTAPDANTVWTGRPQPGTPALYSVIKANDQWVATGYDGTLLTSPDAITWTANETGTDHELYAVIETPSGLMVVGEDGAILSNSASTLPGTGDQDGDGIADILENYFGTSISQPNASPLMILPSSSDIRWPEMNPTGVTVTVQWSPDLETWLASGEAADGIPARAITMSSPAADLREASLERTDLPVAYLRLQITTP